MVGVEAEHKFITLLIVLEMIKYNSCGLIC